MTSTPTDASAPERLERAWALWRDPNLTVADATIQVAERWPHLDTWNRSFDRALETWSVRRHQPVAPTRLE